MQPRKRQEIIIKSLLEKPRTFSEIEFYFKDHYNYEYSSATFHRDLKDLRQRGSSIFPINEGLEYYYHLDFFELDLYTTKDGLICLTELIDFALRFGLITKSHLHKSMKNYKEILGIVSPLYRFDYAAQNLNPDRDTIKTINNAIIKGHSISFFYIKPISKEMIEVAAYPYEFIFMDKYLYLSVFLKSIDGKKKNELREYRFENILTSNKYRVKAYKNDKNFGKKQWGNYLKCRIYEPLSLYFDYKSWNLKVQETHSDGSITYAGIIDKSNFRIMRDVLSFLPHIDILENSELKKNFRDSIKEMYQRISS